MFSGEKMLPNITFRPIQRADGVSDRFVVVALAARFADELLSGLPSVLLPTIRSLFGLSYAQVGVIGLVLDTVSAMVEPIGGLLIDVWRRPWLMAWGAAGIGLGTVLIGAAPTFALVLVGFAVYGLASGPLAHTADVVLLEAYPTEPERIYARSTLVDNAGALLGPLLLSASLWLGLGWRWVLIGLGASSVAYAAVILRTHFPSPVNNHPSSQAPFWQALRGNLRDVLGSGPARTWLLFLFAFNLAELPQWFAPIWLREQVGMSQAQIGVYRVVEMAVGIGTLYMLDGWLSRFGTVRLLRWAALATLAVLPAWLFVPGVWSRFVLAVPLSLLRTLFWPIGKAQLLVSVPGRGGTAAAVSSVLGLIPLPLLFGLLAEVVTLTGAMFWTGMAGFLVLGGVVWVLAPAAIEVD
jgi:MFS family permease